MEKTENKLIIRNAEITDVHDILDLVKELALYERAPHEVTNTVENLIADGFGPQPLYKAGVAELEGKIVGMYFWYIRYSTWKGKGLYLEDIIVKEANRGQGIGNLLMNACIADAAEMKANFMIWQVLDWNEPAINFYKKYDAEFDPEWLNVKLTKDQIANFIKKTT